jgi:putative colanic acid biosynthesis glycosyltransferase WcaI
LRVLIVSAYYWPEPAGNAPYVTEMAEFLAAREHDIQAVVGLPHYPTWRAEPRRSEERSGVRIRRHRHYVPQRQSAWTRAAYEGSLFAGAAFALPRKRPDLVLGVSPALSGAVLAIFAARFYRCRSAVIFQDLMGLAARESGVEGGVAVSSVVRGVESWAARNADRVGIVAEGFRHQLELAGALGARVTCLPNWTLGTGGTSASIRDELGWGADEFVCLHAGNMGHKQGLENVLAAAALLEGKGARIVLLGGGNQRPTLEREATRSGLRNVIFMDPQPTGRFEQILASADALIVNQRESVATMSLPSKLTSYFAAAKPIVAAVSEASETAREIERAGGGVLVAPEQPGELADAITDLQRESERAIALGTNARRYADAALKKDEALRAYERFVGHAAASCRRPSDDSALD